MKAKQYVQEQVMKVSSGVAFAIFVAVGIGFLIQTLGNMTGIEMLFKIGKVTTVMLAPALGAGIAYKMEVNALVLFSAMSSATLGAGAVTILEDGSLSLVGGDPVGALIAATVAVFVGKKITGTSKLDMITIPIVTVLIGGVVGVLSSGVIQPILLQLSHMISGAVEGSPVVGSMIMSVLFAIALMSPLSSAALSIALALSPLVNGALLIGTTSQFFAYAFVSWRDNDMGGFLGQLIVTPKLQLPNLIKNPTVMIGPLLSAAICAPLATVGFGFQAVPEVGGMGFSAFVSPIWLLNNGGLSALGIQLLCGAVLPILITYGVNKVLYATHFMRFGDLALSVE